MHHVEFDPDRLLDEVVARIRELEVPACPRELGASAPKSKRFFRRRLVQAVAALLIAAFVGVVWLASPPGISKSAFAQMQEALAATKTISYQLMYSFSDGEPQVSKFMSIGEILMREESVDELTVFNFPEGAMMTVSHKARTAVIDPLYPAPEFTAMQADVFKKLRTIPESGSRKIGERELDRRQVIDFMINPEGHQGRKVTVDAKTKLPIRIEKNGIGPDGKVFREEIIDIVFDAPLDGAIFRIEPPSSYAVTDHGRAKNHPLAQIDDATLVVSPETGIGPVKFGAKVDEVVRLLGKPDWQEHHDEVVTIAQEFLEDKEPPTQRQQYTKLSYDSRGFRLSIRDDIGLSSILCFNQRAKGPVVRDFQGQTKEGIRLGASRDDVVKTYGEPPQNLGLVAHWFDKKSGWFFMFHDDELQTISISSPSRNKKDREPQQK